MTPYPEHAEYPQSLALDLLCFGIWVAGLALSLLVAPVILIGQAVLYLKSKI